MPYTSTKRHPRAFPSGCTNISFILAKTLKLGGGADVGFVNFGSKLAGGIVVVKESVSVTHCALTSKIGVHGE
jgi:hypothetical protein